MTEYSWGSIIGTALVSTIMFSFVGALFDSTRFYARLLMSAFSIIICASYGVVASVVLRCVGYHGLSQWTVARSYNALLGPLIGIRFDVEHEERLQKRPAIFISNHQTEMDILMLGRMFPQYCSVTSKKELKYMPFLGWFMALSGTVFIDRANRKNAVASFDSAVKHIKSQQQSVWIFPEGTRSNFTEPDMLPFKKGAFHLAIQAGVNIVPVVVANYSDLFNWRNRQCNSGTCKIRVLEPISTANLTAGDVDRLAKEVREDMLKHLKEIHPTAAPVQQSKKDEVVESNFRPS